MLNHWKELLDAVCRLEEGQQEILERLDRMEKPKTDVEHPVRGDDEWVQVGIDNILSYQAGKKNVREDEKEEA